MRIVPATGTGARADLAPLAERARRAGQGAGIGLGLLSAMCFGTSGTFGAALEGAGWSPAGVMSEMTWNGATLRCKSVTGRTNLTS